MENVREQFLELIINLDVTNKEQVDLLDGRLKGIYAYLIKIEEELKTESGLVRSLEDKLEIAKSIKVEVSIKDHTIIDNNSIQELTEDLARLRRLEAHYNTKATSGATLKHAVADLLTYGLYTHNNETGEMAKEINPMIKTVIHTKNYVIQKAYPVVPLPEPMQHGSFQGSELEEEQGLVVIKRHADKAKAESFIV